MKLKSKDMRLVIAKQDHRYKMDSVAGTTTFNSGKHGYDYVIGRDHDPLTKVVKFNFEQLSSMFAGKIPIELIREMDQEINVAVAFKVLGEEKLRKLVDKIVDVLSDKKVEAKPKVEVKAESKPKPKAKPKAKKVEE